MANKYLTSHSRIPRHSRASGNLVLKRLSWIPAFAGMTAFTGMTFLITALLYITPVLADRPPPQPRIQTSPNISLSVNQDTLNQINKLFTKDTYKDFHKQPKLELFKIPTSNHEH
jgi:hypothetical protein